MPANDSNAMQSAHCSVLRSACLTLHAPQPFCSRPLTTCRRPFRIDVFGGHAAVDVNRTLKTLKGLADPLDSHKLRHLDRDIFTRPAEDVVPLPLKHESAHMLWPKWEAGYADVVFPTLLPLGWELLQQRLPNTTWMISGAHYTQLWEPFRRLSRGLCTFERDDQIEDATVAKPLGRCAPKACFERLSLCDVKHPTHGRKAWLARAKLDEVLGLPQPLPHVPAVSTESGRLRVLFAVREGHRHLLNTRQLVEACPQVHIQGWRISCIAQLLGALDVMEQIRMLREADVLVCMHGGDCTNGIHMRPGRATVEVVNYGFEKASRSWLDLFRVHLEPVIRHVRVVGPPVTMGQPSVLMSWNANGSLPLSTFRKVLHSIVSADGVREFHAWQPRRANESSMSPQNQHGGHCGTTRAGDEGDCERGERGSLAVGPVLPDLAACRDACARCSRCNYVSFSAANKECSWFHSCRLNRLQLEPKMWTQQTDGKFAQVPSDWVSLGVSARHAGSKRIDRHSIPKEE